MNLLSDKRGFSLVEILIVIGILGGFMAAIYSLYITHQRAAYTQDEVADLQQNLRIAMDNITRDVRMAGFGTNNAAVSGSAGLLTVNSVSPYHRYAKVMPAASFITDGSSTSLKLYVESPDAVDGFAPGDSVRIIRSYGRAELFTSVAPLMVAPGGVNRTDPSITVYTGGGGVNIPAGVEVRRGDLIALVLSGGGTVPANPATVTYAMTTVGCTAGQQCLGRSVSGGTPQVISQYMTTLQFSYIMDDGTSVAAPTTAQQNNIRAVNVRVAGITAKRPSQQDTYKVRELDSIVKLRNRVSPP